MEYTKVRIGIVGLGYWGPKLLESLRSADKGEVSVVCDANPQLLAEISKKYNLPGTESFSDLLKENVDAVVIATPPATHSELVKQALLAGKHVFVEKPLSTDFAQAQELSGLAEQKKLVLFVDHTFCYDEGLKHVRNLVEEGFLGEIKKADFEWLGARPKPQGPDVLWDSGPHAVAAAEFVLQRKAESVSAEILNRLETGIPSALRGKVLFTDGSEANIFLAWKDQEIDGHPVPKAAKVVLYGAEKGISFEGSFGSRSVKILEKGEETPLEGMTYDDEPLKNAAQTFVSAVAEGKKFPSDGKFGAEVVKILEMLAKSAGLRYS